MSPGATFERVYRVLKEQLTRGRWPPGERLEPAVLAGDLNASITPVRDALHRLVGERLVEAPRHDGFRIPALTEMQLRDLYDWSDALMTLALRRARPAGSSSDSSIETPEAQDHRLDAAADLFRDIARRCGGAEHLAAVKSLNDRLAAIRVAESLVLHDTVRETADLEAAWSRSDLRALRQALRKYHRRRKASVPEIVSASCQPPD